MSWLQADAASERVVYDSVTRMMGTMNRAGILGVATISALVFACSGDDDPPTTTNRPPTATTTTTGAGMGGSGGALPTASCDDPGVACETEVFFGDCTAGGNRKALWEFLHYETSVPGDAWVEFSVRTAMTEADLANESFQVAGIATADQEQVFPSMPIHLDQVLAPGLELRDYLELRRKLVDASDGGSPGVVSYDIQFSCVEI